MPHLEFTVLLAVLLSVGLALLGRRSPRERVYAAIYMFLCCCLAISAGSVVFANQIPPFLSSLVCGFIVGALFVTSGYFSVFVYVAACWLLVALFVGIFGPLTSRRSLETVSASEIAEEVVVH